MKVAVVQMSSQADLAVNLSAAERLVRQAAELGARLICLPEGFAFLGPEAERSGVAEVLPDGPIGRRLSALSRELGVFLLGGGLPEMAPDPARPYNTSALFSPRGELIERYRKIHLFDVDLDDGTRLAESRGSSPGAEVVLGSVEGLGLGLSICYDLRFPALYQLQRARGAHVLTVPAAFTRSTGKAHWHVLLRARAIETQCYVLAPAQFGTHPKGRETFGHSLIVDPWGEVLAECPAGEGVAVAEIDRARIDSIRRQMPVLSHQRPLG